LSSIATSRCHAPVEEQQVEIVVVSVERDPLLPLHEREAGPQLQ
jgi:hypothetical protein